MVTNTTRVLERILQPVEQAMSRDMAERLLGLRADPEIQQALDDLATRNAEGLLTQAEQQQFLSLVQAGNLISLLQAQARRVLAHRHEA